MLRIGRIFFKIILNYAQHTAAKASAGSSQLSTNSWIKFLQQNKGKYKGKGLGNNWVRQAAADYNALKKAGKL